MVTTLLPSDIYTQKYNKTYMGVMQHFDDDRRTPNYTDPQLKDKYLFNKWHTCLSQQYLCAGCFTVVNEVSTDDTVLLIENYPPSPLHFPTY